MTAWTDDMAAEGWQRVWKITEVDGTTHGGYRWPLPMDHHKPVTVEATDVDLSNTDACPTREGDGLCVVRTGIVRHVTSGGVRLACCIGLDIRIRPEWILGHKGDEKLRVSRCEVLGLFRPLETIRAGVVADLSGADLSGADLSDADLSGADLRYANLRYADLSDADLRDADLRDADLSGADLGGASLWGADLERANLRGANLGRANLGGASLWGADLWGANLTGANLGRADLRRANLWGANLGGADLMGADLMGADLRRANLRGADLWGADLEGVIASQQTAWSAGFNAAQAGVVTK